MLKDGRPLRVMQLMAGAPQGEAEAFFSRLIIEFHRAGIEQAVAIRPHEQRMEELRQAGLAPQAFRFGRGLDVVTGLRLRRMIRRFRPDLVVTWMNRATAACPSGDFVHVARFFGFPDIHRLRAIDQVVVSNATVAAILRRRGLSADRLHHLPRPVDPAIAEHGLRRRWGVPAEAPLAVSFDATRQRSALEVLLDVVVDIPAMHLWLVGTAPDEAMRDLIRARSVADRVSFLGPRGDHGSVLCAADCMINMTERDDDDIVVAAWASRLPVISTSLDICDGRFEHGRNGLLSPPGNSQALAAIVRSVLTDRTLRNTIVRGGVEAYNDRWSWGRLLEGEFRFLRQASALGKKTRPVRDV
ncbi:glycosyltransferase family 4 protein [Tistrella mobilis]|uniref:glycosyltransferase family 4 protein n=1 Tax=Tistrella mobilis TaxID=171437 RepID=UPI003557D795